MAAYACAALVWEAPLMRLTLLTLAAACLWPVAAVAAQEKPADSYRVGVAKRDITPDYPVRLSGFAFRSTESEGVTQRIWAKALAFHDGEPAVLIAVDNLGVPLSITNELARRLARKAGLKRDRLAVTATHTHTAPMLRGVAPTLLGQPIPREHQEHINRYTAEFTDKLEAVALAALADRRPARLTWGIGKVGFATNRRTKGGPVDHDLPVLVVRDLKDKVRAIYVTYACHCVTLSNNKISGDWAGYAQELIQLDHPGAVALVSIGCGGDANPSSGVTGDKAEIASRQGAEIAREVKRLLGNFLAPVTGKLVARAGTLALPLAEPPSREQWEEKAKRKDPVGYHARVNLARLDRGEALRTKIDYPVQTWAFGSSLAMVFLPGEVVVDYALRLKRELDGQRLWINAYANDAPAYIPSERILREGGYEGGGAMIYYDVPVPFKAGLEQKIVDAVHRQLGKTFAAPFDPKKTQGSLPLSPQQSLAAIKVADNLEVELVAAEPLVSSPVAIAFGPDGKLWVCEMNDYPTGIDGKYKPDGRIKVLESTRGDGKYDKATAFLDNIPFPTGVTAWCKGVLVCAAPDILYAEDTNDEGKADVVRKLFSGFGTDNYQARVNSLQYGLDGWVYGSCGLFGGTIKSFKGQVVKLGDRDFRIKPDEGLLEPATGRTQQGRVRDDWGNWFGCDNSTLCRHYPLADHYLRRNPHLAPPPSGVLVPDYPDPNHLYPIHKSLQLFKLSGPAGYTTAACGIGVYRDDLLGKQYTGNVFTCEPVNLIVHRLVLSPKGSTFSGRRAPEEQHTEFLASTDNWFRPVQVMTGPDGCLYVVDMYRFVIEHPRWIPKEDLARLDVRAGSAMGRIYRIRAKGKAPRPILRLDKLDTKGLVAALDSPNGCQRDLAHMMLLWRGDKAAVKLLDTLVVAEHVRPEARLHALCLLPAFGRVSQITVRSALQDEHAGVRRQAVRLTEGLFDQTDGVQEVMVLDPDPQVRLQLACSLAHWRETENAGPMLSYLALSKDADDFLRAAVLSSLTRENVGYLLRGVLNERRAAPAPLIRQVVGMATTLGRRGAFLDVLGQGNVPEKERYPTSVMIATAGFLEMLERRGEPLDKAVDDRVRLHLAAMMRGAKAIATDAKAGLQKRLAAVDLLGRLPDDRARDVAVLAKLLTAQSPPPLQEAAVAGLGRISDDRVPSLLTAAWRSCTPALQSQVLDVLLSRPAWQRHLLASIAKKQVPASQIDLARRQRLLASKDAEVRTLATKLFEGATSRDRQKVLDAFRDVTTLAGDVTRGKAVFTKSCAACHRLRDIGHAVGPDLAAVTNRTPEFLLIAILDPNREVDPRYVEYLAVTKAGRSFTGILASESAPSITLRGQEGREEVLLRADLDELQSTGKSMMPEGVEKDLSKQDLADLLAFLGEVKGPSKKFTGNTPAVVRPVAGKLALLATTAEIYGSAIVFEEPFRNLGYWHGADDHADWTVQLDREGKYDVWLDWACDNGSAGNPYILEGGRPALRGKVAGTGSWDRYRQQKIGTITLPAGRQRLTFRPDGIKPRGALLDLRGLHLVPSGQPALTPRSQEPSPSR
jgi:putative membrane-bound dehydrogenase-like protein